MNYAPHLGAIRGEHVRAAARSIGAALTEVPVPERSRSRPLQSWVVRETQRWDA